MCPKINTLKHYQKKKKMCIIGYVTGFPKILLIYFLYFSHWCKTALEAEYGF